MWIKVLQYFLTFPPENPKMPITLPFWSLTHLAALIKFGEFPDAEKITSASPFDNGFSTDL